MRALAWIVVALALSSCSSKQPAASPSPTPLASANLGAEPLSAQQLKALAVVHFGAFSSGDWGAVWDDFDAPSKAVVTRTEYIHRLTECSKYDPNRGKRLVVQGVADNHDGTWSVVVRYGNLQITFPARYENGHWRFILNDAARAAMRMRFDRYVTTQCRQ